MNVKRILAAAALASLAVLGATSGAARAQERQVVEVESLEEALDIVHRWKQANEQDHAAIALNLSRIADEGFAIDATEFAMPSAGDGAIAYQIPPENLALAEEFWAAGLRYGAPAAVAAVTGWLGSPELCVSFKWLGLSAELCVSREG